MAERLQKYLARAGVASRRHAEELITAGRIQVNNKTVTELGTKVEPGTDLVTVDGTLVSPPESSVYFVLYKPTGVVTTLEDPQGRPTVAPLAKEPGRRLFPVGRLDYDAEGALLLTDDGELAHQLMHPSFQVPRTYLVKVKGVPSAGTLDKLREGVRLEDGVATPKQVEVFEKAEKNTWLMIVVAEGRPHLIKRLCAAIGHPVVRLYRPSYAGISAEGLRPGEKRALSQAEVEKLRSATAGGEAPPEERTKNFKLPPRRHGRAGEQEGVALDDVEELPVRRKVATDRQTARPKTTAGTGTFRGAARRPDDGAADADEAGGFINKKPRSETKGPGRPDREERPARGGFGDRGPRREAGERPARGGFGERGPRREGGERPARAGGFGPRREAGERPARGGFGERGPRREGGERPSRGGFGERGPRREGGERPARAGGFGERGPRREGGERPARGGFGERGPRREGGERPSRGGFGERGGGFGARAGGGEGERPSRGPRAEGGERPSGAGLGSRGPARAGGIFSRGAGGYRSEGKGAGAGKRFGGRDRPDRPAGKFGKLPSRGAPSGDRPARPPRAGGAPKTKRWNPQGDGGGGKDGGGGGGAGE